MPSDLSLEEILKLLDMKTDNDEGLFSQSTLKEWMNQLIDERGLEWVEKNKRTIKESWEYLNSNS